MGKFINNLKKHIGFPLMLAAYLVFMMYVLIYLVGQRDIDSLIKDSHKFTIHAKNPDITILRLPRDYEKRIGEWTKEKEIKE